MTEQTSPRTTMAEWASYGRIQIRTGLKWRGWYLFNGQRQTAKPPTTQAGKPGRAASQNGQTDGQDGGPDGGGWLPVGMA